MTLLGAFIAVALLITDVVSEDLSLVLCACDEHGYLYQDAGRIV